MPHTLLPGSKTSRLVLSIVIFPLAALLYRSVPGHGAEDELAVAMAQHLACYPTELIQFRKQKPLIAEKDLCLATIYHESGGQPLWVENEGPTPQARIILDRLARSHEDGLDPVTYEVPLLQSLWDSHDPADLARLDTLLTYNLVRYIHDMSFGQLKFRQADPQLFAEAGEEGFDPVVAAAAARSARDLAAYLEGFAPPHDYYRRLKQALARYRDLAQQTDWQPVPDGPLVKPGDADERLGLVARNLESYGITVEPGRSPFVYDDAFVASIQEFQQLNGLKQDGIIGPNTLGALNRSPAELVDIIRANLARWRWQAHRLGESHVMINIAGFSLKAVDDDVTVLEMPVIVGQLQHQTPVFSDQIKYLDINPYWNVPPSIARREELPALRLNPLHLVERHIRLFSSWQADAHELDSTIIDWHDVTPRQMNRYKLRQDPGAWNALGRIKFVFPNHYSVYLHDTPTQDLFSHTVRSFSHGCIRVSKPLELALFCLRWAEGQWTAERIEQIIAAETRTVVSLSAPLTVHITYQTAWVDNRGIIHFNSDIYGRDAQLLRVLDSSTTDNDNRITTP